MGAHLEQAIEIFKPYLTQTAFVGVIFILGVLWYFGIIRFNRKGGRDVETKVEIEKLNARIDAIDSKLNELKEEGRLETKDSIKLEVHNMLQNLKKDITESVDRLMNAHIESFKRD